MRAHLTSPWPNVLGLALFAGLFAEIVLVLVGEAGRFIDSPEIRDIRPLALASVAAVLAGVGILAWRRGLLRAGVALLLGVLALVTLLWAVNLGPYDDCGPWTGFLLR